MQKIVFSGLTVEKLKAGPEHILEPETLFTKAENDADANCVKIKASLTSSTGGVDTLAEHGSVYSVDTCAHWCENNYYYMAVISTWLYFTRILWTMHFMHS